MQLHNTWFSSKDLLNALGNILLGWANNLNEGETPEPVELANACPSPAASPMRRFARNSSMPQMRISCVQQISGEALGKGSNLLNLHEEFVGRCVNCDGAFPTMK